MEILQETKRRNAKKNLSERAAFLASKMRTTEEKALKAIIKSEES